MNDADLKQFAEHITRPRENFAYGGDLSLEFWGYCFSTHRDDDVIDRANWQTICTRMASFMPEDWRIEHSTHWAVGWVDEGRVRLYVNDDPKQGYTAAFLTAYEIVERLREYPVLDDDVYCRLVAEEGGEED